MSPISEYLVYILIGSAIVFVLYALWIGKDMHKGVENDKNEKEI